MRKFYFDEKEFDNLDDALNEAITCGYADDYFDEFVDQAYSATEILNRMTRGRQSADFVFQSIYDEFVYDVFDEVHNLAEAGKWDSIEGIYDIVMRDDSVSEEEQTEE